MTRHSSPEPTAEHQASAPGLLPPELDFEPVPLRARRDGWTPDRQRLYVAALACLGHGGQAAALVGLSEQTAARLRARPEGASFGRACERAWQIGKGCRRAAAAAQRGGPAGPAFSTLKEAELTEQSEPSGAFSNLPRGRAANPGSAHTEGKAAVFEDARGNLWKLVQLIPAPA
jgi:hypothetical protein